eukprot:4149346-Pleurochrysis_carterae.AAC.3
MGAVSHASAFARAHMLTGTSRRQSFDGSAFECGTPSDCAAGRHCEARDVGARDAAARGAISHRDARARARRDEAGILQMSMGVSRQILLTSLVAARRGWLFETQYRVLNGVLCEATRKYRTAASRAQTLLCELCDMSSSSCTTCVCRFRQELGEVRSNLEQERARVNARASADAKDAPGVHSPLPPCAESAAASDASAVPATPLTAPRDGGAARSNSDAATHADGAASGAAAPASNANQADATSEAASKDAVPKDAKPKAAFAAELTDNAQAPRFQVKSRRGGHGPLNPVWSRGLIATGRGGRALGL